MPEPAALTGVSRQYLDELTGALGIGPIHGAGLRLLDLEKPGVVLRRTGEWVFGPAAPYEVTGDVGRVMFPCGWTLDEDADRLHLYYGGADSVIGLATARHSEVMAVVRASPGPAHRRASDSTTG